MKCWHFGSRMCHTKRFYLLWHQFLKFFLSISGTYRFAYIANDYAITCNTTTIVNPVETFEIMPKQGRFGAKYKHARRQIDCQLCCGGSLGTKICRRTGIHIYNIITQKHLPYYKPKKFVTALFLHANLSSKSKCAHSLFCPKNPLYPEFGPQIARPVNNDGK